MQKIQSYRKDLNETFIQNETIESSGVLANQNENGRKSAFLREIVQNDKKRPEALCKTDIYKQQNELYIIFTSPGS